MDNQYGTLYICATPIGNLGDVTLRVLETLKGSAYIAAEDTRRTLKLLNRYEIKKTLISYHEHNKLERSGVLMRLLKSGADIALVSDAGMPAISDPGWHIVSECIKEGVRVSVCPGASACVSALVLSGFQTDRFVFEGFLPKKNKERYSILDSLKNEKHTVIFYEAPHRLIKTLKELYEHLGDRKIAIIREMTKIHEEVLRTTISDAIDIYGEREIKGELALVIEGASQISEPVMEWAAFTINEHVEHYMNKGFSEMEAIKKAAKDRGVPKRDIYGAIKCRT